MRDGIDAYDFILNGFENDLDTAQLYWIIKGAGGSDNVELQKFLERLKMNKIASAEDGQEVQAVTVNIPYAAREVLLDRISQQLYRDFMSLDLDGIVSGANTATQIKAAYTPLDLKTDLYEYCVTDAIQRLLKIVGIEDKPTYKRNQNINKNEEIQNLLMLRDFVDSEYITRTGLTILGDGDQADEVLRRMDSEDMERMSGIGLETAENGKEEEENGDDESEL